MDLINDHGLEVIRKSAELVPNAETYNYKLRTSLISSDGRYFSIDKTNALNIIEYAHHEIHSGDHFFICGYETINAAQTITFGVTTPNTTKWAHVLFDAQGTDALTFAIYEGSVFTDGTPITPINNNRNSANPSVLTVVKTPSLSNAGTLLYQSASGSLNETGILVREREIILKQNTKYYIVLTSLVNSNTINYCAEWYEEAFKA